MRHTHLDSWIAPRKKRWLGLFDLSLRENWKSSGFPGGKGKEAPMSESVYAKRTKQGYAVLSMWDSDGCYGPTDALVLRKLTDNDFELIVALGYDPKSGEWGQGRYFGRNLLGAICFARTMMAGHVIGGVQVVAESFFFDGCHRFYLVEDEEDLTCMENDGWDLTQNLHPIEDLPTLWETSCPLRFISTVKLVEVVPRCFKGDPFKCRTAV
jgi:hypothetical protein